MNNPTNRFAKNEYDQMMSTNDIYGGRLPPALDQILRMISGIAPSPIPGSDQSLLDAYNLRERTRRLDDARNQMFLTQRLMQNAGVDPNGFVPRMASAFGISLPDNFINKFMAPFIGGNPLRAQLALLNNITGLTSSIMGNPYDLTGSQSLSMMESLQRNFYRGSTLSPDFARTRGFRLEDYANAFARSVDTGLFGFRGMSPEQSMDRFMKSAPELLSAARSVFGAKPGQELVQDISNLLGTATGAFSTEADQAQLASTLRQIKGMSQAAKVSIEVFKEAINAGKSIMASDPALMSMGGNLAMNVAVLSMSQTAGLSAVYSKTDAFARQGGMTGIFANLNRGAYSALRENVTQELSSAYGYAMITNNTAAQKAIQAFYQAGDFSNEAVSNLRQNLQGVMGLSAFAYNNLSSNKDLVGRGATGLQIAGISPGDAAIGAVLNTISGEARRAGLDPNRLNALVGRYIDGGMTASEAYINASRDMGNAGMGTRLAQMIADNPQYADLLAMRLSPEAQSRAAEMRTAAAVNAQLQEQFDISFAQNYVSFGERLGAGLLSGELGKEGFLKKAFDAFGFVNMEDIGLPKNFQTMYKDTYRQAEQLDQKGLNAEFLKLSQELRQRIESGVLVSDLSDADRAELAKFGLDPSGTGISKITKNNLAQLRRLSFLANTVGGQVVYQIQKEQEKKFQQIRTEGYFKDVKDLDTLWKITGEEGSPEETKFLEGLDNRHREVYRELRKNKNVGEFAKEQIVEKQKQAESQEMFLSLMEKLPGYLEGITKAIEEVKN